MPDAPPEPLEVGALAAALVVPPLGIGLGFLQLRRSARSRLAVAAVLVGLATSNGLAAAAVVGHHREHAGEGKAQQASKDAAVKAALRDAATAEETFLTDQDAYVAFTGPGAPSQLVDDGFHLPTGVLMAGKVEGSSGTDGYCLAARRKGGPTYYYDSSNGGLLPAGSTRPAACPDAP